MSRLSVLSTRTTAGVPWFVPSGVGAVLFVATATAALSSPASTVRAVRHDGHVTVYSEHPLAASIRLAVRRDVGDRSVLRRGDWAHASSVRWTPPEGREAALLGSLHYEVEVASAEGELLERAIAEVPMGQESVVVFRSSTERGGSAIQLESSVEVGSSPTGPDLMVDRTLSAAGFLVKDESGADAAGLFSNSGGGVLSLVRPNGQVTTTVFADPDGDDAGVFLLNRIDGEPGFLVDGSYQGTGSTRVEIHGPDRSVILDMSKSGDASVELPAGSIDLVERADEPGVAHRFRVSTVGTSTVPTSYLSRTIEVPAPGWVLALGNLEISFDGSTGPDDCAKFEYAVSETADTFANGRQVLRACAADTTGVAHVPVHDVIQVEGVGNKQFDLVVERKEGEGSIRNATLTLLFVAQPYGLVGPEIDGARSTVELPSGEPRMSWHEGAESLNLGGGADQ